MTLCPAALLAMISNTYSCKVEDSLNLLRPTTTCSILFSKRMKDSLNELAR